ncbi:MAG TPA: hypothetical protein VLD59_08190 [Steroidobacteraceae bacterium]|nr:hypothetical protein [Steroidobacteraceae bacterium]
MGLNAKTAAQRKADERQRHREAGRVAVTVHVRKDYVPVVRALEARLQRRERREAPPVKNHLSKRLTTV